MNRPTQIVVQNEIQPPPLRPVSREQGIPLSFGQERLFFLQRFDPESWRYNLSVFLRVFGELDTNALERGIGEIVRRHEVIRTTFALVNGTPVQVIGPVQDFKLALEDLKNDSDPEGAMHRIAGRESRRLFDLTRGPLFRALLIEVRPQEHFLLLTMHHVVGDAWSLGLLARELSVLYGAFHAGQESRLPELPVQYADYAVWQRDWMQGELCEEQLAYWKEQMSQAPATELPALRMRPSVMTYTGSTYEFWVPAELCHPVKELARREAVTLFMTMLAALYVLLQRYSSQSDIVVGTPISGRNQQELEDLIGFFLNTLPLRATVNGRQSFRQFLKTVRQAAVQAFLNQDVPYERIVDEVQPQRDLSRSPLFQVLLVVQHQSEKVWSLTGLEVKNLRVDTGTAKFELSLALTDRGGQIQGAFDYMTDVFENSLITQMSRHFVTLLNEITSNPDKAIDELEIMAVEERRQLLFRQGETAPVAPVCVHELFERQAKMTPQAPAVAGNKLAFTYEELEHRANQLAHYLRRLGVGPERRVAVCLKQSAEMVVALLGVMKAGGAYVPLDPDYPPDRLAYMLEDSQACVLLTQQNSPVEFPEYSGVQVQLDALHQELHQESQESLKNVIEPENLVYVIYTSGSTGKPKGVQICHSALVNFLTAMSRHVNIQAPDVLLAVTSLSFDIAGLEIYLPLACGAQVRILDRELAVDGRRVLEELSKGVTIMQATPSTWLLLLEAGWRGSPGLKVLCGGEALTPALASKLASTGSPVWNLYGPTETTIWSLIKSIQRSDDLVTIGRPIANTQVYILNGSMMPVPEAVTGELYLGGDGLARGYLHRAELSAEKFLPNPFASQPGARLYRTGDRVRWLPDGQIEFLGRTDNQIKIRGYRVELGEIEAVVGQQTGISEAVVVVAEQENGEKSLKAFVTGVEGLDTAELRARLKNALPAYMVPAAIIRLGELPLMPNGKVDRRALQRFQPTTQLEARPIPSPAQTEVEKAVISTFCEVLGLTEMSLEDNFFDLGGDSLLAMRAIARLHDALNIEPSMRILFMEDTIRGFTRSVEKQISDSQSRSAAGQD